MPWPVASPETAFYVGISTDAADGFGSALCNCGVWREHADASISRQEQDLGLDMGLGMAVAGLKIVCGAAGIS